MCLPLFSFFQLVNSVSQEVITMKRWGFLYILTAAAILAASLGTRHAITVFSESSPIEREWTILIDPGHGGEDGGAPSCTGAKESDINLEISLRLGDLFSLLGQNVKFVRTTDISVYREGETLAQKKASDLKERLRMTQENGVLLLSIHQNTFPQPKYSGAQVFYASSDGSKQLAQSLQESLNLSLCPGSRRTCKQSQGVYLMERVQTTAVLVECGFLSNPREEAMLRDPEYQKKLCCVICTAIRNHLSNS